MIEDALHGWLNVGAGLVAVGGLFYLSLIGYMR